MFDKSKWIWYTAQAEDDTYGEFYAPLQCREGEKTVLRISCDGRVRPLRAALAGREFSFLVRADTPAEVGALEAFYERGKTV